MVKLLQYYLDISAKQPADTDERGNIKLKFEEIPIQGHESQATIYVKNSHSYPMYLDPVTTDPDLTITRYPSQIKPDEIAAVTFSFRPKPDRITPLNASWDFEKTIYEE
jgi:hypothetical protein